MLQLIRDRAQGFVVGIIVLFICLTFALWGVEEYLGAAARVVVAEVDGESVELPEFQRMFQRLRNQAQMLFGDQFDAADWSGEAAKLSTLDQVVEQRLLLSLADDSNMRVSDRQVVEQIRNSDQFNDEEGRFSADMYARVVNYSGFSEVGFENQMRRDLLLNQLRTGIAATAFTTNREARVIEQLRQQKRDIGFAIIPFEKFEQTEPPGDEEIISYYEKNDEDFRIQERAALEYVTLSIEQLMKEVTPNEAALVDYYEANAANYTQEERRNANHILIQVRRTAPDGEVDAALVKANLLRAQALESGASFEQLATDNSDDIGSKAEGGETGLFGRGVMAPEFEEAVFSMSVGEISEPIRTDFGYHIIKLKAIEPGGLQPFDAVRDDVDAAYRREQAEAIFYEQAEQLSDLAYEHPDSLDVVAETLNLTVQKTDAASRDELGLRLSEAVVDAAFAAETLIEGLNSAPVEASSGEIYVVRVASHQPSRIPALQEVRDEVIKSIRNEKAREAVSAYGEALVERLNGGEDPEQLFASESLEWVEERAQGRDSTKINRAVLREAFRATVPEGQSETYLGVAIGSGDFAVVKIANVTNPDAGELLTADVKNVQNTVARNRAVGDWRRFLEVVKDGAEIKTYPENL